MLQVETLPASLMALLAVFRPCFTAPTFRTFCVLVAGMIAQPGRRTVCGMLAGAGLGGVWQHGRAHWFFAGARWSVQQVGLILAGLVVAHLVPPGAAVRVAIDDTLFRRSGRRVHAAFWQHDGSRQGPKDAQVGFGNNWLIAGIIVDLPFMDRPVCLPVAFALVPKQVPTKQVPTKQVPTKQVPTKQVLAGQLVTAIAAALPGRSIDVVADSWYAGADGAAGAARGATRGRGFPPGVSLTSRLRANATLRAIATPSPGRCGRPKRIGAPLGKPKDVAGTAAFTPATVRRYGGTDTVELADIVCLWYGVYRSRTVRVILLREPGRATTAGYHLALITTDLHSTAAQIVERYATRWSIEVAIEDAKQITGVGQARNRTPTAVARTAPFGLITQSLTVLWYTLHGHTPTTVADRRAHAPWYRTKTHPAYHDMITKLRRILIAARFRAGKARNPTPQETIEVHQAWAEAAA